MTTKSLEDAMLDLEKLVNRMESGELSLDDSLAAFEQGIMLSKQCQDALKKAEQRVSVLLEKSADAPLADFNDNDDNSAPDSEITSKNDSRFGVTPSSNNDTSDGFEDDIPF